MDTTMLNRIIKNNKLKRHNTKIDTVYKKTEKILYNYLDFINIADWHDKHIKDFKEIEYLSNFIDLMNEALDSIMLDEYYEIIELIYFDKMKYNDVLKKLNISRATLNTNKHRLVKEVGKFIFCNDYIKEMLIQIEKDKETT